MLEKMNDNNSENIIKFIKANDLNMNSQKIQKIITEAEKTIENNEDYHNFINSINQFYILITNIINFLLSVNANYKINIEMY